MNCVCSNIVRQIKIFPIVKYIDLKVKTRILWSPNFLCQVYTRHNYVQCTLCLRVCTTLGDRKYLLKVCFWHNTI